MSTDGKKSAARIMDLIVALRAEEGAGNGEIAEAIELVRRWWNGDDKHVFIERKDLELLIRLAIDSPSLDDDEAEAINRIGAVLEQ